jgi:hypothetical protein
MKYFLDTEFIEGFKKPLFGKRRHFIDLISIGIVAEDGREYYAISTEFNPKDASKWVKDNVISKLPERYVDFNGSSPRERMEAMRWKSNKEILRDIIAFTGCWRDQHFLRCGDENVEFYGYYADYDWVLFCSLFGRMIDLPKGFPMFCMDLQQMKVESGITKETPGYPQQSNEHSALHDARWNKQLYEFIMLNSEQNDGK